MSLTQTNFNHYKSPEQEETNILMLERWRLKIWLFEQKDVKKQTWGKIFIKLRVVTQDGKPDKNKGAKYRQIYYRYKRALIQEQNNSSDAQEESRE
jgi:hypothetical protein